MVQAGNVLILAELDDAERSALEAATVEAGFGHTLEPSAEGCVQKLGTKRFEALVVHMGTPGAALACMRARGKLLRVRMPVIALADVEDDAQFAKAYRASADEVLVVSRPADLTSRLLAVPKQTLPQPGSSRGDAVVADADRTRAEVIERVLRDAGFRVEMAMDGFAARLQAGRPSLKVAVVDASLDDVPSLIAQARAKASRCAWVIRARPEQLDELRQKTASFDRVSVVSAYGPPEDVLFETNRMIEPRATDGRGDARQLYGTIVRLRFGAEEQVELGYTYNVSPQGLFVRTLLAPRSDTLEMWVVPPGGTERVRLEGRVVWRREFGATRREPVPAGFGVQVTGGEVAAWGRAVPLVPSLRPPGIGSERAKSAAASADAAPSVVQGPPSSARRPSVAPRSVPRPGPSQAPPASLAAPEVGAAPSLPADATPLAAPAVMESLAQLRSDEPRPPQSSVDQMLAQVLEQTLGAPAPGALPVVLAASTDAPPPVVPAAGPDELEAFARALAPPSPRDPDPLDITPASLGFHDEQEIAPPAVAPAAPAPSPEAKAVSPYADTIAPPPEESAQLIAASASDAPPAALMPPPSSLRPAALPTAASLRPVAEAEPWALVPTESPDFEAALKVTPPPQAAAPPDPQPAAPPSEGTLRSAPPSSGVPSSAPPLSDPVPSSWPPRAAPSRSRLVGFALLAVLGGAIAALVLVPARGEPPSPVVVAPSTAAAVAPEAQRLPAPSAAEPAPSAAEPAPSAAEPAPSAAEPAPSAAPSAPSVAPSAPSAAPSAEPPALAPASAVAPQPAVDEPTAAELAALPQGQGILWVDSPLSTNVYVYGKLAGTTHQRITTKCGPRFLRLGTAPGVWQSEGLVAVVKCGGFSRVELAP